LGKGEAERSHNRGFIRKTERGRLKKVLLHHKTRLAGGEENRGE